MEFTLCRREESVSVTCLLQFSGLTVLRQSPTCWPLYSTRVPRKSWRRVTTRRCWYRRGRSPQRTLWNAERSSRTRSWLWEGWPGCLLCFGSSIIFKNATDYMPCNREESEKVSELKSVSGSNKLPYGTLASGTEGIRDAINGFEDALVLHRLSTLLTI